MNGRLEGARICLVSPGHLGSNPRLVKEADALVEAGCEVEVIFGDTFEPARVRDEAILGTAQWKAVSVELNLKSLSGMWLRLRQKVAQLLFGAGLRVAPVARLAHHPLLPSLEKAATKQRADLYIGHCLAALPVVVRVARKYGAKCGFDAEDYHSAEQMDSGKGRSANKIAKVLERVYLGQCDYVTASSPLIAKTYAEELEINAQVVLNVFPKCQAPPKPILAGEKPSFYWFSQTIGPGRGLEKFLHVLRSLKRPCDLDLRGHVSSSYQDSLKILARGSEVNLRFLEPDVPDSMVKHAAGYTAGLSLENQAPTNRDLCLTNKVFTYLLAGTPSILSHTRAHLDLLRRLGKAAVLIDLDQPEQAAGTLRDWLSSPEALELARQSAWRLGQEEFNWDQEKQKFLSTVEACLGVSGKSGET